MDRSRLDASSVEFCPALPEDCEAPLCSHFIRDDGNAGALNCYQDHIQARSYAEPLSIHSHLISLRCARVTLIRIVPFTNPGPLADPRIATREPEDIILPKYLTCFLTCI